MISPQFLQNLFDENYIRLKQATAGLSHEASIQTPSFGGNCIHWIVGHLVVSRCNFLTLLDEPSIWDWPTCKLFIPGSSPTADSASFINLSTLLADFYRTEERLQTALKRSSSSDLDVQKGEQSIGEHLVEYLAHEAYHTGQLEVIRQWNCP